MNALVSELANCKAKLSETQSQITDRQLELARTLAQLTDFQSRYSIALTNLYQKLDRMNNEISKITAEKMQIKTASTPKNQPDNKQQVAIVTTTSLILLASKKSNKKCNGSKLNSLFRLAARTLHPDFASSEHERQQRCRAMAEVNSAYDTGDIETIRQVLELWTSDSNGVVSAAKPDELNYVIKQLAFAKRELIRIQEELSQIKSSQWHLLYQEEKKLKAKGKDLIVMLSREAKRDISKAERVLQSIKKGNFINER